MFADIDPVTWCLSAESFEANISERTRAVIVVDLYGGIPDIAAIRAVADRHGIAVIEDAAEAFGSELHGRKAGSFGDTGVFSFHGSKTMTTGEGGMLVTNRDDIRDRVLFLRDHGRAPGDVSFFNHEVAFKYRMSSMQAALGLAQVERAEELVTRKRDIFSWYANELAGVPGITLNAERDNFRNSFWMITLVSERSLDLTGEQFQQGLKKDGIDSRPFFNPLSSIPAYRADSNAEIARAANRVAYSVSPRGINLPSGMRLTQDQVHTVCRSLKRIVRAGSGDARNAA
ncbi:MAG: DegT/DnrJ/EryC1/StrS family aminotransferase [Planctomycetes bacterium]|nr:DegT/DnrJ/EryC1/StrS family aminotransferase [Planctomycetota bacterium]